MWLITYLLKKETTGNHSLNLTQVGLRCLHSNDHWPEDGEKKLRHCFHVSLVLMSRVKPQSILNITPSAPNSGDVKALKSLLQLLLRNKVLSPRTPQGKSREPDRDITTPNAFSSCPFSQCLHAFNELGNTAWEFYRFCFFHSSLEAISFFSHGSSLKLDDHNKIWKNTPWPATWYCQSGEKKKFNNIICR